MSKVLVIKQQEKFTQVNSNIVRPFRHEIYDCFLGARDALFNPVDALPDRDPSKIVA